MNDLIDGGRHHFCKKKKIIIYIYNCTSMPVLANFGSIWMLHSEDINIFIHALALNLSFGSAW